MGLKNLFLILSIIFTTSAEYQSYKDYKVYNVIPKTEQDIQILVELENSYKYQFWSDITKVDKVVNILVAPEKQLEFEKTLANIGIESKVVIEDVQKLIDIQLQRPKLNRLNNNYDWSYYQNFEEILQWMDDIVAEHSDVAEIVNIGRTFEGRDIVGVKIDFKKRDHPEVGMIECGVHAREWISPATCTWIIKEFLTSNDPDVRALGENIVWHIFPVVNPDGYAYTFTNNRMWRKNRNQENNRSCSNWNLSDDMSNGIDLNRNFGFVWMSTGASNNPCAETYAGPTANSEHETRAIINYVTSLKNTGNVIYYFAYHSYAQMVLVPYSHVSGPNVLEAPNYADMYEIAMRGMEKLQKRHGTVYTVGTSGDILYYVSGSSFDWARGVADIPIVYLFELRGLQSGEFGFLLPPEQIIDNNEEMMDGLVEIDRVTHLLGYYHRSGAVLYTFNVLVLIISLIIVM